MSTLKPGRTIWRISQHDAWNGKAHAGVFCSWFCSWGLGGSSKLLRMNQSSTSSLAGNGEPSAETPGGATSLSCSRLAGHDKFASIDRGLRE